MPAHISYYNIFHSQSLWHTLMQSLFKLYTVQITTSCNNLNTIKGVMFPNVILFHSFLRWKSSIDISKLLSCSNWACLISFNLANFRQNVRSTADKDFIVRNFRVDIIREGPLLMKYRTKILERLTMSCSLSPICETFP